MARADSYRVRRIAEAIFLCLSSWLLIGGAFNFIEFWCLRILDGCHGERADEPLLVAAMTIIAITCGLAILRPTLGGVLPLLIASLLATCGAIWGYVEMTRPFNDQVGLNPLATVVVCIVALRRLARRRGWTFLNWPD